MKYPMDFTRKIYHTLLSTLQSQGFSFQTFAEFLVNPAAKITVHPKRWTNNAHAWIKELVMQNIKNMAKLGLIALRKKS